MARVSFDAEFMKQLVPSVPISHAQDFQVVRDEQSRPIIFSVGTDHSLFALLPNGTNGQTLLLRLGPLFGLSTKSVISSMSALQGEDLVIYLTFAVDGEKTGDPSTIYVVRPSKPAEWVAAITNPTLAPSLLKDASTEKRLIKKLYLAGAADPTNGYPLVVAVYSKLDGSRIDAACLDISVSNKQWKYSDTFELPETPANMKAMCAGALPAGINGLFCLYDSLGTRRLTFAGFKGGPYKQPYSTSLRVPPGGECLATFVNKKGFTDLLIGGADIAHYTAIATAHSDPPHGPDRFVHVTSSSDPYFKQLRQITIAQAMSQDTLTIYGRNGDDTIVYQRCNITPTKVDVEGPSIPLLPSAQGGGPFTVLLDGATASQKLFIIGNDDTLTRMEQSGGTHLWERIHVLVPSAGENKEITSYTSHIHVSDQSGVSLTGTKFLLCSSSAIELGSNGGTISVTPSGVSVTTDQSGDITLIQNVTGISSVVFTLKDDPGAAQPILGNSHVLNPAAKVQRVLDSIKTSDDAMNARLPSGGKLMDHASAEPGDIGKAAKALPLLSYALGQMPSNGDERKDTDGVAGYSASLALDISDWGVFQWLSSIIDKIEDFFVDAWHFVVKFAGKVFTFLLNSLSHVLKAIHWLLQDVLGIPIDKIIEWLGFLFQWDDILETHDIISAMVNTGIDCAIAKVNDFATVVDGWFAKGDEMIKSLDSLPDDIRNRKESPASINSDFHAVDVSEPVTKTPGSNWSSYQLKHGGVEKSLQAQNNDPSHSNDPLLQFWNDVAGPLLDQIRKTLEDAMKNIAAFFQSGKELSFGQLLQHFGVDLLRDVLGIIRKIFVGLIKFVADFASDVKVLINKSINIPLLTPLYRWMSKGHDLTMLDAVALLIAVPATVVYKAVTGKKPGDIDGVKEFLQAYKDHHSGLVRRFLPGRAVSSSSQEVQLLFAEQHGPARFYFTSMSTFTTTSGIDIDDLLAKLKKIGTRVGSIVTPIVNFILLLLAPGDWYTPGAGGAMATNPRWGWKIAAGILVCVLTYPYDDIPGHSDLRLCRQLTWGLGILAIPATPTDVRIRGVMALATGCFQLVPEAVSVSMAISSAADGSYGGNLDSKMVWADICDRLFALVAKGAGGVCMLMNTPEPISFFTAWLTSDTSIACQVVKAVKYHPQAKTGMPQASLFGLS